MSGIVTLVAHETLAPATGVDSSPSGATLAHFVFEGNPRTGPKGRPQGRQDNRAQRGRQPGSPTLEGPANSRQPGG